MTFLRVVLFVLVSVLGFSHCAFVDTLSKCSLADKKCHKNLIQKVLKDIAVTGVPELKIPPIDPIELKHLDGSILNVIHLEIIKATVKGIKSCVIDSTDVNIEHLHSSIQLTCDVIIEGNYNVKSTSPFIHDLLGGAVHGEGFGKVKIEKITVKIEFPFQIVKRGNDIFLTSDLKKLKYTYNIHDKVTFAADRIYLGDKESSKEIVKLLNENWKVIIDSFGSHFLKIAMNIIYDFLSKFFGSVPTKHYLIDDLSAFV